MRRTVADIQVKRRVEVAPVRYKPEPRKNLGKAENAVHAALCSFLEFLDLAADVPSVDDDITEEDAPQNLQDLTSKDDRGPADL